MLDCIFRTKGVKSVELLWNLACHSRKQTNQFSPTELANMKRKISTSIRHRRFQPHETVVRYGEESSSFFVLEEGTCAAYIPNAKDGIEHVATVYDEPGQFFGELSLLRGQPRAATIKVGDSGATLAEISDKQFFLLSNMTSAFEEAAASYEKGGQSDEDEDAPVLDESMILKYSASIPQQVFSPGETIIREAEPDDTMFILEEGSCSAMVGDKHVKVYERPGEYFGELALLTNEARKATIIAGEEGAAVAVITREVFDQMLMTCNSDAMSKYALEAYN